MSAPPAGTPPAAAEVAGEAATPAPAAPEAGSRERWLHAVALLALALAPFVLEPGYLATLSRIIGYGLLAASLALLVGFVGLPSLGHAAFFGIGAYTAGIFSKYVWGEPVTGLLVGALLAGLFGKR